MPIVSSQPISFEFEAMNLAGRIAAEIVPRSLLHAQQRAANVVLPEDVKAAMVEMLGEIQSMLHSARDGAVAEIEFSDSDFEKIARLPFRRPDVADDADDDL
jgi:hypothetical protein